MGVIIHISGAPGCGKSTLGEELQTAYPEAVVFDTDYFIQHHTRGGQYLTQMDPILEIAEYDEVWRGILDAEIKSFLYRYRHAPLIILVGILDNFGSPVATYHLAEATHRFYIDLPIPELCRRYYTRLAKKPQAYWDHIQEYLIDSSPHLIQQSIFRKKWHEKGGYIMGSWEAIQVKVERLCERVFAN